ncbi:hypothetical protein ABT173_05345 [Streptomyces sp. NPDC001795]|uniref:hypothetical protein n=1 Tax=unclassified Streptomyces TaxID=2593676 RepID=UPI003325BCF2
MLGDVGQRLLHDAVRGQIRPGGEGLRFSLGDDVDHEPGSPERRGQFRELCESGRGLAGFVRIARLTQQTHGGLEFTYGRGRGGGELGDDLLGLVRPGS